MGVVVVVVPVVATAHMGDLLLAFRHIASCGSSSPARSACSSLTQFLLLLLLSLDWMLARFSLVFLLYAPVAWAWLLLSSMV